MRIFQLRLCGLTLAGAAALFAAAPSKPAATAAARALESVPAWFEPNRGLLDAEVKYFSQGAGYRLSLDGSGAEVVLSDAPAARVRLSLAGGRANPEVEPLEPLAGRTSYMIGRDRSRWRKDVPQFGRVRYRGVYPGIDLVFRGAGKYLEYDFVVAPGADPSRIRLRFQGADSVRLSGDGSLQMKTGGSELHQPEPFIYQNTESGRVQVAGSYTLGRNREVGFRLANYDRTRPLVIDPVLVCAGYFGGDKYDVITGLAYDPDGSIWLAGTTRSVIDFPPQNAPYQDEIDSGGTVLQDTFLAKLRIPAHGRPELLYYTYFGGNAVETGGPVLVDAAGMVYLTGTTTSFDLPVTDNAFSEQLGGVENVKNTLNQDAFIAKFNPASETAEGSLLYCSYFGGTSLDIPTAMSFDNQGRVLLAGYGGSTDIDPMVSTALQPSNRGSYDGFLAVIDTSAAAAADAMVWSTYWGGAALDVINGVAVDAAGFVYFSGYTLSQDLPLAGDQYQAALLGSSDVFVVKLDLTKTNLDTLVYATYIGGSGLDIAQSMKMDAAGTVWVAGYTTSGDFPVTASAFQHEYAGGGADAFLLRVDPSLPPGDFIVYSTYIGGSGADVAYDLSLAGAETASLTGYTLSNDFPLYAPAPAGHLRSLMADVFVSTLDTSIPGVGGLRFSTYFGGSHQDVGAKVLANPAGDLFVTGTTVSRNLPVTDGSTKPGVFGATSGFVLRFDRSPED